MSETSFSELYNYLDHRIALIEAIFPSIDDAKLGNMALVWSNFQKRLENGMSQYEAEQIMLEEIERFSKSTKESDYVLKEDQEAYILSLKIYLDYQLYPDHEKESHCEQLWKEIFSLKKELEMKFYTSFPGEHYKWNLWKIHFDHLRYEIENIEVPDLRIRQEKYQSILKRLKDLKQDMENM